MTREGKGPLAAFIAALLVAVLLTACGSSDSDSSTSTEATNPESAATNAPATSGADGAKRNSQTPDNDQSQSDDQNRNDPGEDQSQSQASEDEGPSSQSVETPLEVSGGGSEQFRTKGGDNSIQEYGEESDESELREAAEVVHGFYVARAEGRWDDACSYLAESNIRELEQLANQAPESAGADCPTVLKAFTRPLPAAVDREITTVDAGSLRREGDQGFLIYYGAGHVKYAMPLTDEGGTWKVAALSGTTLG